MSADTSMPKGITRGYSTAFRQMVSEAACKVLTIPELKALDDADLKAAHEAEITPKFARGGLIPTINLGNEAA